MPKSKPRNPIVIFVYDLLDSRKTTKEKICVACDLRYPTLDNMFTRPLVSQNVRRSLYFGGVITKKLLESYEEWYQTVWLTSKKKERRQYAGEEDPTNRTDQLEGEDHRIKENRA